MRSRILRCKSCGKVLGGVERDAFVIRRSRRIVVSIELQPEQVIFCSCGEMHVLEVEMPWK